MPPPRWQSLKNHTHTSSHSWALPPPPALDHRRLFDTAPPFGPIQQWSRISNRGGGNCLFHAISSTRDYTYMYQDLRQDMVHLMYNHQHCFISHWDHLFPLPPLPMSTALHSLSFYDVWKKIELGEDTWRSWLSVSSCKPLYIYIYIYIYIFIYVYTCPHTLL